MSEKEIHEIMVMLYTWAIRNCQNKSEALMLCLALPVLYEYTTPIYLN